MKIRTKMHRSLAVVILFLIPVFLMGCAGGGGKNMPYEPDTPEPAPHEGTFVSEYGTMAFPGDGKSVTVDFNEELAECLGLPEGEQGAEYVFLSGELPPHGKVPVRYDTAHMIRITEGKGDDAVSCEISIGMYKDGSFSVGTGCTTAERITFFVDFKDDGENEAVDFLKQEQ